MVFPLNDDFSSIHGKLIESQDFEKLDDQEALNRIGEEFPKYRKVKAQEGFQQIFGQHLGVVEAIQDGVYSVRAFGRNKRYLAGATTEKPVVGSDVQFIWNHQGESTITKVLHNLLEEEHGSGISGVGLSHSAGADVGE